MDYTLASKAAEQAIIDDILGSDRAVNAALYQTYANNLRRAIDRVFAEDDGSGLSDRLRANVSRFAAYKAYHATRLARQAAAEPDGDPRRVLHTFNRYQAAEYNTTVSRSRTAKQWGEFADADHMRLFPNLRWLPSRSATPREEHVRFYNRVWAKTDPFWQQNQPGNLWNCKCDWEETDDPCTAANPTTPIRHNGLEGNPALTGQVFTDNHAYVSKAGNNRKERDRVEKECRSLDRDRLQKSKNNSPLLNREISMPIGSTTKKVEFTDWGIREIAQSMFNDRLFWLKNELLKGHLAINDMQYIRSAKVDLSHNSGKTIRKKRQMALFHYICFRVGDTILCAHIAEMRNGSYVLYTITKNPPKYE